MNKMRAFDRDNPRGLLDQPKLFHSFAAALESVAVQLQNTYTRRDTIESIQCLHKETSERRTRHGTCLHPAETRLLNSARSTAIAPKVSSHEDRNRAAASEFQRVTEGDRAHSYGDHDLSRGPSCRPRRASLSFSKYVDESQQTITTASAQRSATRIREPHS